MGEIANLAGVGTSAVSNWRSRHRDFPLPIESGAAGDLFDLGQVLEWLRQHKKAHKPVSVSLERAVWSLGESLRGSAQLEEAALLTLQLIFLRQHSLSEKTDPAAMRRLWNSARHQNSARDAWTNAVDAITRRNADLRRAMELPVGIQEAQLQRGVDLFANLSAADTDWGKLSTAVLRRYEDALGMRGAYVATPESVTDLVIALLEPIRGTLYDPAAGFGMVLARAWDNRKNDDLRLLGQEVNEYHWRLGYLHLAIKGAHFELASGDTLLDDRFRGIRADRALADPPLGVRVSHTGHTRYERCIYGVPRSSNDWLWAQQLLFHLAENGVGVMIASTSALFKTGIEAGVRQGIVEANILDAVIELPPGLLPGTSLPLVLLVLARNRKNRAGRILFVDGRQLGISRRGKPRELTNDDIQRLTSLVAGWRKGHLVDKPLFAAGATVSQLAEADYNLSPSRYVGYKSEEVTTIEGEEIGERFAHLRDRIKAGGSNVTRIVKQIQHGADAFVKDRGDQWPLARIGDLLIAAPRTGMRQESEREGLEETPYITTRLVSGGPGYIDTLPSTTTRGDVRDRLTAAGDLLLVSRGIEPSGSIRCATVRFDGTAAYSESLMRLRFDPSRVEPDYLRWYLTSRRGRSLLSAVTTGTVIANLRGEALVEVKLPLPPIDEQHRIVAAMRNVERGVEQLSKELNEANALLDTLREGIAAGMYIASSRR